MELKQTAMQELLHNLKNMGEVIPSDSIDTTLRAIISAIEYSYLEKERLQIVKSFNAGEMNVWDRERDGDVFEFEDGTDYYKIYYLTPNDLT